LHIKHVDGGIVLAPWWEFRWFIFKEYDENERLLDLYFLCADFADIRGNFPPKGKFFLGSSGCSTFSGSRATPVYVDMVQ
jgi:hypothetical protein